MKDEENEAKLKQTWTKKFIEFDGFNYLMSDLMNKETIALKGKKEETSFETMFHLTQTAFILKMLRIFVVAAFSAEDPKTYEEVVLGRRTSQDTPELTAAEKREEG
jgi:hypothetical protein